MCEMTNGSNRITKQTKLLLFHDKKMFSFFLYINRITYVFFFFHILCNAICICVFYKKQGFNSMVCNGMTHITLIFYPKKITTELISQHYLKATHNPVISNNFSFFLIIIPTHTHLDLFVITVFIGLMGVLTLDLSFICRIEQS